MSIEIFVLYKIIENEFDDRDGRFANKCVERYAPTMFPRILHRRLPSHACIYIDIIDCFFLRTSTLSAPTERTRVVRLQYKGRDERNAKKKEKNQTNVARQWREEEGKKWREIYSIEKTEENTSTYVPVAEAPGSRGIYALGFPFLTVREETFLLFSLPNPEWKRERERGPLKLAFCSSYCGAFDAAKKKPENVSCGTEVGAGRVRKK